MMPQLDAGREPAAPAGSAAWREAACVLALLAALGLQLGRAISADGLTNDEVLYIAAGHRHLDAGDYRPNPNQPPVAKLAAALGLVGLPLQGRELRAGDDPLHWAYRFVFTDNDPATVVPRARLGAVVAFGLLCAVLWLWARSSLGATAGIVALAAAAFHPSLLAHGHLATTDLVAAFGMLLTSFAFWRWSRAPSLAGAAAVGLSLGLAIATRLTGLLMVPAMALLALLEARRRWSAGERHPWPALGVLVAALALAPAVVWASYGFRYEPWPGASVLEPIRPHLGLPGRVVEALRSARALPEAYLEGVRYQLEHGRTGHPTYLLGRHSNTGWWHYYLVAVLVKNTPVFLAGAAAALVWAGRRLLDPTRPEAHAFVPAAIVLLAASASRIQIGERYVLAVYPYLVLIAASAAARASATRWGGPALAGILALHAASTLSAAPAGHLAYFNVLAGGPPGGHRVLLDSNLDWGQDLPRLAEWMRREGVARVQLAYHGSDDPDRFGIAHDDLPGLHLHPARLAERPQQGVVAVSPNLLLGLVPRLRDPYAGLRARPPDARAGVFFIYRLAAPDLALASPPLARPLPARPSLW
jgi:hypothetical protein